MADIELSSINKFFGKTHVIKDFSLNIKSQSFTTLVGPSGCGKSTLLRMIAGLEETNSGKISIDGEEVNNLPPKERNIAMVFQSYALYPHKTVSENIAFPLKVRGISGDARDTAILDAAKQVHMESYLERYPRQLSGGQRQRVALARAIVRQPDIFLMDEPLSNLDAKLRVHMRTELKRMQHEMGITTVYVTHDQVEAMTLADRIIIMKDGFIEQIGSPIEVFNNPVNVFVATFIGSPPTNIIECDINKSNDQIMIKLDRDIHVHCPNDKISKLANLKKVIIGIRAEDIIPVKNISNEQNALWTFSKEIDLAEPLGTETQLFFKLQNQEIISRMYNPRPVDVGENINFQIENNKIHFFDYETKKAI